MRPRMSPEKQRAIVKANMDLIRQADDLEAALQDHPDYYKWGHHTRDALRGRITDIVDDARANIRAATIRQRPCTLFEEACV